MTHRSWTRHIGVALVLAAVLTLFPMAASPAAATEPSGPTSVCRIDWRRSTWHVRKLIRCAANHFDIGVRKSLRIAFRESRFRPRAFNESTCAKGIYQHLCRYWRDRAEAYGFDGRSAFNARANVIVTMRMVRRFGWAPWGG
jgi:hypothetical protein